MTGLRMSSWVGIFLAAGLLCAQSEDIAGQARRADALLRAGQVDAALDLYRHLARAAPRDAGIALNLSIAEFKARRYGDAVAHAAAAAALNPHLGAAYLMEGAGYYQLAEYQKAVAPLRRATEAAPQDRNAHTMLAETLLELQRYGEALENFQALRAGMPESPRVWYGLGRAWEGLAATTFESLSRQAPDSPYAWELAGDAALARRQFGQAAADYVRALAGAADPHGIHQALATVYRQAGLASRSADETKLERALPPPDCARQPLPCDFAAGKYEQVLAEARALPSPAALYWSAKAYGELSRQAYERLESLPESRERHLYAARTRDAAALYMEAAREWREALRLSPGDSRAAIGLIWSLYRAGDSAAAAEGARDLQSRNPGSAELNFLYGASLLNLQEPDQALPHLQAARRQNPHFLPAEGALGQALLRLGRAGEAIAHLKAALPADQDGSMHFELARAYQLAGQPELARRALAEYQDILHSMAERTQAEQAIFFPAR